MKRLTNLLAIVLVVIFFDFGIASADGPPSDNFDDNVRGELWQLFEDDPAVTWVVEDVNRLNVRSIGDVNLVASCAGHWKMNDNATNTTVEDSSGNGNHGTFNDAGGNPDTQAHHTDSGNPPNLNGALTFDGTDDYVTILETDSEMGFSNKHGSVSAWIKSNWVSADLATIIVNRWGTEGWTGWGLYLRGDEYAAGTEGICFDVVTRNPNIENMGIKALTSLEDRWYHIVGVWDDPYVYLYVDGELAERADTIADGSTYEPGTNPVWIGCNVFRGNTHYFNGLIDNVIVFNRALTAEEIAVLHNGGSGTETIPAGSADSREALYVSSDWRLDATKDFELKVDFHYSDISDQKGWAGITVENDNAYVSISAGSDGSTPYFYYETVVDGNTVFEQELRDSNDGTLYISYDADSNNLYLSHVSYGDANAYDWQTTPDPIQGQWASEPVEVTIGGGSVDIVLSLGDAYLDNFEVTRATLVLDSVADFNNDGDVDFEDFAILGLAWRSSISDDNYNPIYDISEPSDGIVDERDLAILCDNWLLGK